MKSLVIAEKPSVAADLAKALGKVPKKGDVYENDQWVISSAVGHLVELEMPEDIDKKKYGFWRLETLPIIPEEFGLKPIEDNKEKFTQLKKLLARKDVGQVINACDAGREGELIFVYIYQLAKSKLPVKRAWMQSMTADGIKKAFDKLRDGSALSGLADAARCRSESDWLIGINGTRALTKRMFGSRAGNVASVGRVQTPTLAIVYARELEIRNFKPRAFWRLSAQFQIALGGYEGVYQKPDFKRDAANEHDRIDRLWEQPRAETVLAECKAQPTATVREEKKPTTQASPRLYDLTTLQREANGRFGLSARRTLQIAQALYERHKMITYPRTDSRALPEDYAGTVRDTMQALVGELATHAAKVVQSGWIRPGNKKIFNNAQISDHFAIIPTTSEPKNLEEMEAKVYDMIARRFVAAFFPEAQFDVTTRISTVAGKHAFKTEGKVLTEAGWLAVYGKSAALEDELGGDSKKETSGSSKVPLPALSPADAEKAKVTETKLHHETTKPPPRYTEATLLSAMEGAGKLVEDEDMAEAMKERGLGTPATRADTIDGLINQKYMERQQRELVPTPKAESLIQFLGAVKAEALTSPAMTGDWEFKLRQMEQGRVKRDDFMKEVIAQTVGIVERVKGFEEDESNSRTTDIVSPTDGQPMYETLRGYKTQDGTLMIYKVMTGRKIEEDEVRQLVTTGEVGPLDGFVSPRNGARFAAKLKIVDDEKSDLPGRKKIAMDFGEKTEVGDLDAFWTDPKTGAQLCEAPTKYILREKTSEGGWEQAFSLSRILCKRELTRDDVVTCITTGRTPLIENFTSKFGRPFKAYLVRSGAKANFEFPPREAKTGKDGKPVERKAKAKLDLSAARKLGPSPAHKEGELYQTDDAFIVAKSGADDAPRAVFTTKREVAGKQLAPETIRQLLAEGRTELLDGFMSKAGRAFSAYLVLSKDKKKADFEFPPR